MRIAVLAGGTSTERNVSLASGALAASALREAGHDVALADPARPLEGDPWHFGAPAPVAIPREPPTMDELGALRAALAGRILAHGVEELCRAADVVFIALHGGDGEDGRLQAALSLMGVRHTGPSHVGCTLAFHKDVAKALMRASGLATADWRVVPCGAPAQAGELPAPWVVKPVTGGSTVGVRLVRSSPELEAAVVAAHDLGTDALVERYVPGRELTVAVLAGRALPVIEIRTDRELFDYEAKYQPGGAEEICPAPIPEEDARRAQALAVAVCRALRLGPEAGPRVDFRWAPDGQLVCLEANPLPGLTAGSLFPLAARTAGMDLPALFDALVRAALA